MANLGEYKGVIPTFYARYDAKGNVSPERVRALTEYHIRKGVKGAYVNGSLGEYIYQSLEDRKIILENIMATAGGGLTAIVHMGCNNTKDSAELAKYIGSLSVDTIISIPSTYFHPLEYAIAAYWDVVGQAALNTNFIIYNIPQLADAALIQNLLIETRKNPRVISVKDSSMSVQDIQMFKLAGGDDCITFNSPGEQFISGHAIGVEVGTGETHGVMPELFLEMDELVKTGKMEKTMKVQYTVSDIIYKMRPGHGNMYGMIKEALRINESLDLGGAREPLPQLIESDLVITQETARVVKETVVAYR